MFILAIFWDCPQMCMYENSRDMSVYLPDFLFPVSWQQSSTCCPKKYMLLPFICFCKGIFTLICNFKVGNWGLHCAMRNEQSFKFKECYIFQMFNSLTGRFAHLGPHVQKVLTHKKVAYALFHVNDQMYQERGNVRCLTPTSWLAYILLYSCLFFCDTKRWFWKKVTINKCENN